MSRFFVDCESGKIAPQHCKGQKMNIIETIVNQLKPDSRVLDMGCGYGGRLASMPESFTKFGVDKQGVKCATFEFILADLDDLKDKPLSLSEKSFDLVISEHCIEHLKNPLPYFAEMVRLCKVGGFIVVIAPSDRSTWFAFGDHRHNATTSFFDDPTHIGRPQTPQSLMRLGRYHSLKVVETGYLRSNKKTLTLPFNVVKYLLKKDDDAFVSDYWQAIGWECFGIFQKTTTSHEVMNYHSLKGLQRLD